MERFYSDYNQIKLRQVKEMLDDAGVPCFIKNEFIQGASGEIPPHEALPEIWLNDGSWASKANKLLKQLEDDLANMDDVEWVCTSCNETNEGQFMLCWQCQESK